MRDEDGAGTFLGRWSRRKVAARRGEALPEPAAPPPAAVPPGAPASVPSSEARAAAPAPELPSLDTLKGLQSEYEAFMRPEVDPATRTAALKRLFADPHFNAMDGLDVYIDDYTKPDPIEPEILAKLAHTRYLFDPPKTRVNERGEVEDVPPDEAPAATPPGEPAGTDAAPAIADAGTSAVPGPQPAPAEPVVRGGRETP